MKDGIYLKFSVWSHININACVVLLVSKYKILGWKKSDEKRKVVRYEMNTTSPEIEKIERLTLEGKGSVNQGLKEAANLPSCLSGLVEK